MALRRADLKTGRQTQGTESGEGKKTTNKIRKKKTITYSRKRTNIK